MALTLASVRRIAGEVVSDLGVPFDVIAARRAVRSSPHIEVFLAELGCEVEPRRVIVAVNSRMSETECREAIIKSLEGHSVGSR